MAVDRYARGALFGFLLSLLGLTLSVAAIFCTGGCLSPGSAAAIPLVATAETPNATVVLAADCIVLISRLDVRAGLWSHSPLGGEVALTEPLHASQDGLRAWIPSLGVSGVHIPLPPPGEPLVLPAEWDAVLRPRLLAEQIARWRIEFSAPP